MRAAEKDILVKVIIRRLFWLDNGTELSDTVAKIYISEIREAIL